MPPFKDLTGQQCGRLTVKSFDGRNTRGQSFWICECSCGNTKRVAGYHLKPDDTSSCGCFQREQHRLAGKKRLTHGRTKTRAYKAWISMKGRCLEPTYPNWENYGGRGITICERWMVFENFYEDVGDPPDGMSLDRYPDNNGNYEPGNVRWATRSEQQLNKRTTKFYDVSSGPNTLVAIAKANGMRVGLLSYRLAAGWTLEEAIGTPKRAYTRNKFD